MDADVIKAYIETAMEIGIIIVMGHA